VKVALVGDRSEKVVAHAAIPRALDLVSKNLGVSVEPTWVPSDDVRELERFDAIWVIPGSPYRSMEGVLRAIRHARETGVPFLGTCGGFQHAMIEWARNVIGVTDAEHAESSPDAPNAIVTTLACGILQEEAHVKLAKGSRIAAAYEAAETNEEYQCRFGLDPNWRARLEMGDLAFVAFHANGEVRGAELRSHRFFVATLFQPERAALHDRVPPLVRAFVRAAG